MTAHEPPNPYATPSAALEHEPASPGTRKHSRLAALASAFLAYPVAGAGFYILGLRRRFVAWTAAGVLTWALLLVSVWVPAPRLCVFALAALVGLWLPSLVATGVAKPATPVKHAWLIAALMVVAARGANTAVKRWLVEGFNIPSGAMTPALLVGDHIMVKKGHGDVRRGDVIVFKLPQDTSTDYVKRVVAVGGDTIEVRDGVVSINGSALDQRPLDEPCTYRGERDADAEPCKLLRETNAGRTYTIMHTLDRAALDTPPVKIPPGAVFVMGDNRDNSYDSRRWGTVAVDLIKGTATLTWWSRDAKGGVRWSRVGHLIE